MERGLRLSRIRFRPPSRSPPYRKSARDPFPRVLCAVKKRLPGTGGILCWLELEEQDGGIDGVTGSLRAGAGGSGGIGTAALTHRAPFPACNVAADARHRRPPQSNRPSVSRRDHPSRTATQPSASGGDPASRSRLRAPVTPTKPRFSLACRAPQFYRAEQTRRPPSSP